MVNLRQLTAVAFACLVSTLAAGCAAPEEDASAPVAAGEQDLTQLSDAALMGKLGGILKDVSFTSESDYPYIVFSGEAVTEKRLSTKLVRQKLRAAVKQNTERDIGDPACRASRVSVSNAISDGDAAVVPADKDSDDYLYAHHDKQLMIALKTMRSQLRSVVGFTFGTNASGDQDEFGPVVYVYVGISKTTGKLIAISTQAVYT